MIEPDLHMVGINNLIIKKIDSLSIPEETKQIMKDLLMIEFMNQQRGSKTFFEQFDDVFSRGLGVEKQP